MEITAKQKTNLLRAKSIVENIVWTCVPGRTYIAELDTSKPDSITITVQVKKQQEN